ncbi:glycoside hydrolase [Amylocystis lapponica]|nr:glycoside hydrolase [Amylocystis lapponica]
MPAVPLVSPATGNPIPSYYIHTTESHFVDNAGRTLLLRGVNLSGSCKAPIDGPSYSLDGFWEGGESGWGFNMLRYVVTWDGKYDHEFMDYTVRVLRKCKEHGFKVYVDPHQDIWSRFSGGSGAPFWTLPACGFNPRHFTATQAAIVHCEYPTASEPEPAKLPAMIWGTNYGRLASQTLFTLFFAGRDFAPKCILDGQNIQDYLQSHYIAAMGELADRIRDAGDLLDECVIGWDSMNEPYEGLCGYPDLTSVPSKQTSTLKKGTFPSPAQSMRLGMGQAQTVDNWKFGAMGPSRDGTVTIDPKGLKVWADPETEPDGMHPSWGWRRDPGWKLGTCIWALHGVWDVESGYVIVPDYFRSPPLEPDHDLEFIEDYWRLHWEAFSSRRCCYSAHYYDGLTLVTRHWNWFNADALGLLRGKYSSTLPAVKIGESAIRKSLQEQLGMLREDARFLALPHYHRRDRDPIRHGRKEAYGWTDNGKYKGDYSNQQKALDASLNAADGPNALSYTIWNYCTDNSIQKYKMGSASASPAITTVSARASSLSLATLPVDNGANVSQEITSFAYWENAYDFLTDGARAVKAFCRPFPTAVIGLPTDIQFNIAKVEFKLTVRVPDVDEALATEIYVPLVHYASDDVIARFMDQRCDTPRRSLKTGKCRKTTAPLPTPMAFTFNPFAPESSSLSLSVQVSDGRYAIEGQTLKWWYSVPPPGAPEREHTITITRVGGAIKTAEEEQSRCVGLWEQWCSSCLGESCTLM